MNQTIPMVFATSPKIYRQLIIGVSGPDGMYIIRVAVSAIFDRAEFYKLPVWAFLWDNYIPGVFDSEPHS